MNGNGRSKPGSKRPYVKPWVVYAWLRNMKIDQIEDNHLRNMLSMVKAHAGLLAAVQPLTEKGAKILNVRTGAFTLDWRGYTVSITWGGGPFLEAKVLRPKAGLPVQASWRMAGLTRPSPGVVRDALNRAIEASESVKLAAL